MILVEEANQADIPVIVDFQLKMAHETENIQLDREVVEKGVQAVFENSARGKYYVARSFGKVIGCMLMTSEWSDWRNGEVLWFQSVYIESQYRKQGIFRKMFRHLQELVKQDQQYKGLRLYVERTNLRAQQVYEALGMNGEHYQMYEWMK
jgi:ribosomal protein S18 acetylase RimI-like enzyme